MKVFRADTPARLQWHHADGPADYELDNNLTEVGREQMREVGRWLAHRYGETVRKCGTVEWHSSGSARCVESGSLVGEGLVAALGGPATAPGWPTTPITHEPDIIFRSWNLKGTEFKQHVTQMPSTPTFQQRACEVYSELRATYDKLGCVEASEVDTLMWTTYVHLVGECEAYSGSKSRSAMCGALSAAERAEIERHACWVWTQRFFQEAHAAFLGARLWELIGARREGVSVFSGHDYTALALLAYLGERRYAPPALGFGCLVVVEHYDDGSRRVLLNPQPFRDAQSGAITNDVRDVNERLVAHRAADGSVLCGGS